MWTAEKGLQKQLKELSSQDGNWATDPREASCILGTVGMNLYPRREEQSIEGKSGQRRLELFTGPKLGYK